MAFTLLNISQSVGETHFVYSEAVKLRQCVRSNHR